MKALLMIAQWIGAHSNKIASAIRAFMYMAIALAWTHMTESQIGSVLLFTEAFLGLFVETNTVSKARVGERIDEKIAKRSVTGTGTFPLAFLVLSAGLLTGCASNVPPNISPEGRLAAQALPVTAALRGVIPSIKPMVCTSTTQTNCLKVSDAQLVIANIDRALRVVEHLALVLKVVDESTTADGKINAMLLARQAMNEIQREISEASIAPSDEFARQAVSGLLRTVTESMFLIGGK